MGPLRRLDVVEPAPGRDAAHVLAVLRRRRQDLEQHRGGGGNVLLGLYSWADATDRELRGSVSSHAVDRLLWSRRMWAVRFGNAGGDVLQHVYAEIEAAAERFDDAIGALVALSERWGGDEEIVVPDTNVFLHYVERFDVADWHALAEVDARCAIRLVVPMTVVDELDGHKRGKVRNLPGTDIPDPNDKHTRARHAVRELSRLIAEPSARVALGGGTNVTVEVLEGEGFGHGDNAIVRSAAALSEMLGRRVRLITLDLGAGLRGRLAGLSVPLTALDADLSRG